MLQIIPIRENITLENIKKSNYWNLIAILVWNHYSEKENQVNTKIEIKESWYGLGSRGSSHSIYWDNPKHTEENYIRTLGSIKIIFTRSDYITIISINVDGEIHCHGHYTDTKIKKSPCYHSAQRNMEKTNWLLTNNFITIKEQ